jgi:GMP synthase-like glutamine amidotransferase
MLTNGAPRPLKICIIDMNDGQPNQAMRCLRLLIERFSGLVTAKNPGLLIEVEHVSPRDKNEELPRDADLYLSSGGPGSPFDGDQKPWFAAYRRFVGELAETARAFPARAPSLFAICYSFELVVRFFELGEIVERQTTKFGVMPVYTTDAGRRHPLTVPFSDRLFAFEHRRWEAVHLDEARLASLGGSFLARESRDGVSKGRAILALDFGPGIEGVQFHPEADRPGVLSWIKRVENEEAFREAYGEATFHAMIRTLNNPARLARTFDLFIPRWLSRRFNAVADERGWRKVEMPGGY